MVMDKLNTLISLNDVKKTIDELILKLKHNDDDECSFDSRRALIIALSVIGALVVVGVVAYAVYKHFSNDDWEDYDDLLLDDEDEDDDEFEDEAQTENDGE